MTRDEWIAKCALRYVERAEFSDEDATDAARTCAEVEEDEHGAWNAVTNPTSKWTEPAEAADNDMDNWTNDE